MTNLALAQGLLVLARAVRSLLVWSGTERFRVQIEEVSELIHRLEKR